ncbi:MAG: hypothetical protein LBT02_01565 [Rickettsiales bacterium]|jgi:hypothetical protein|nr:hypothetical protein [Rickettsiales bacterium]
MVDINNLNASIDEPEIPGEVKEKTEEEITQAEIDAIKVQIANAEKLQEEQNVEPVNEIQNIIEKIEEIEEKDDIIAEKEKVFEAKNRVSFDNFLESSGKDEDLIEDLESVDDDFAAEIQATLERELAEAEKKKGVKLVEEETEEEINLNPLEEDNNPILLEIKGLSVDNIDEYLISHAGAPLQDAGREEVKVDFDVSGLNVDDFNINGDLWGADFDSQKLDIIKKNVKIEIKSYIIAKILPMFFSNKMDKK